ncbi:unnamed protein product [Allacma fusca]|uniref:Uncharacterized protein n=1 Tax=Allacma fusca TaxID=39272 RepID=A0A8J2NSQ4_9HEXA|nr:unnamed protein product [Allacma fusca]
MGSSYDEEKKKIKERYGRVHSGPEDNEIEPEEISTVSKKFLQFERENELDERSRNFRLRSYDDTTPTEKRTCSKLNKILKRLLIIALIITVICATVFFVSKILAKNRLETYKLVGNQSQFETFRGVGSIPVNDLGYLELQNVELNASDLITSLQGCHRLKTIKLQNVRVRGEFNGTVRLPSLVEFVYDETIGQKSVQEIMSSMTESKLKSILFFRDSSVSSRQQGRRTAYVEELDLTKIWDLDVNINITFEGHTIIVVNHTRGELVLPWLTFLKREEIIQNAGRELRKLSCNRHKLSVDALHNRMTHLTFRDVKLVGGDFSSLVKKLTKLVDIRMSFGEVTPVDIADLPRKTLRNLALSKISLSNSKSGKTFKLHQLTFLTPSLSWEVVRELDEIFKVDELAISEYSVVNLTQRRTEDDDADEDPNGVLLKNVLKTEAERILMYKYRGVSNDGRMQVWANATGISKGTSSFVLEKIDSQWNSRNLEWSEWSAFKHQAMGFDQFWAHIGIL